MALDGVLGASRWMREDLPVPGGLSTTLPPKYLVIYEFADPSLPAQEAWLSLSGENLSDWSRRMIPQMRNTIRGGYRLIQHF